MLFMVDTCQAESMFQQFYSPNILGIGSSKVGEDSLSVIQKRNLPKSITINYINNLFNLKASHGSFDRSLCDRSIYLL